jgi:hypothetical protein
MPGSGVWPTAEVSSVAPHFANAVWRAFLPKPWPTEGKKKNFHNSENEFRNNSHNAAPIRLSSGSIEHPEVGRTVQSVCRPSWRLPGPPEVAWPAEFREHATKLGKYLRDALPSIECAGHQPVPLDLVKFMAMGALALVTKIHNLPDLGTIHDTLQMARSESKAAADDAMQALHDIKMEPRQAANTSQQALEGIRQNNDAQNETKTAARESTEIGRTVMTMVREMKNADQQNRTGPMRTYASVAAGNGLATSIHNPLNQRKVPSTQVLREVIVNIRNPMTIASLRAMNPRSLKAHVDRATEQNGNEHIEKIKTVSTNQLKSGDLSIKTATAADMEVLRQFAEDWEHRIGNGAIVRIPTYGVLVHGIRTSSMDMDQFEDTRDNILQENKPFIPNAGIKYIGWLSRTSATKTTCSVVVELTRLINEGLI